MYSLLISFAVLIVGCFVYGKITEKIFAPDDRQTPAVAINDGVDCVPMKTRKAFMTAVSITYLFMASEGFQLNQTVSYTVAACAAVILFAVCLTALIRKKTAAKLQ